MKEHGPFEINFLGLVIKLYFSNQSLYCIFLFKFGEKKIGLKQS